MKELAVRLSLCSLLLIILGQTHLVDELRWQASLVTGPLRFGATQIGKFFKDQSSFWLSLRGLAVENQELRGRLLVVESQLSEFLELRRDNESLRRQLGLELGGEEDLLAVRVLGWEGSGIERILVISGGEEAGVGEGMPVAIERFLLGKVYRVGRYDARVRLITDPLSRVFAVDQDSSDRTKGVVRGFMPGRLVMERIFKEESISPGDTVITSGEGGEFPAGLILGEVGRVEQEEVLKKAILHLEIDFSRLEEVFVLR